MVGDGWVEFGAEEGFKGLVGKEGEAEEWDCDHFLNCGDERKVGL